MDESFRSRLVRELQVAEEELARRFSAVMRAPDSTPPVLKDESTARLEKSRKALVRVPKVKCNQGLRQDMCDSWLSNEGCSSNWKRPEGGLEKNWLVSTTS